MDIVERLRDNPVAHAESAAKEIERLRAEVVALNQPVKLSEWQELVAERDRLRELLREARPYLNGFGWGKPGVDLPDRIDSALKEGS